jgi:hypothetical protein
VAQCHAMNDSQRFNMLRAKYRSLWDAHQIIADNNAAGVLAPAVNCTPVAGQDCTLRRRADPLY